MKKIEQTITSMEVAEMVGKKHADLMRDIRRYAEQLAESNIALGEFFKASEYKDANNQSRPCYEVTKKGCEFIAHKLTGIKGTEFTAKYINRFHEMEDTINKPLSALEQLQLMQQATLEVSDKVDSINEDLHDFKQTLPLLAVECDRITNTVKRRGTQFLGGKKSNAYSDKSLRGRVYADIHGQVKRQFGVSTYKAIRRNQCDKAVQFINSYEIPFVLQDEIKDVNAQMNFLESEDL